jgi:hypothetical protein
VADGGRGGVLLPLFFSPYRLRKSSEVESLMALLTLMTKGIDWKRLKIPNVGPPIPTSRLFINTGGDFFQLVFQSGFFQVVTRHPFLFFS